MYHSTILGSGSIVNTGSWLTAGAISALTAAATEGIIQLPDSTNAGGSSCAGSSTPLEPGEKEYKCYAPGVGLVQDGSLKLVKYGKADEAKR